MPPADVQALLYKVYTAAYRIQDLAGTLQPDKWKVSDQDRASFVQTLNALRSALEALEKPRSDFHSHPEDAALGRAALTALKALQPQIDQFVAALAQSPDAAAAADYKQPAADLAGFASQLEPYVAYLEAKELPPSGKGGTVELKTEEVHVAAPSPPITFTSAEKPPLAPTELKALLDQVYVPEYRLKDLLGQENTEHWAASHAERGAFNDARAALETRLAEFEKWRGQWAESPENLEDAFQAYVALGDLFGSLDAVTDRISHYDGAQTADNYRAPGQEMAAVRDKLLPYVTYLLRYHDQTVQDFRHNLAACESQLSYAMRPQTQAAVPMKNVLPVFQGRRQAKRDNHRREPARAPAKRPSKPPGSTE
jgi:hypothetical protein